MIDGGAASDIWGATRLRALGAVRAITDDPDSESPRGPLASGPSVGSWAPAASETPTHDVCGPCL